MINVITFPSADIDGDANNKSFVTAVHHPVVVDLQRTDFVIDFIEGAGGDNTVTLVWFVSMGDLAEAVVGEYIYLKSGNGVVDGVFLITYIDGVDPFIGIEKSLIGLIMGGFVNYTSARKNHFIETIIIALDSGYTETIVGSINSVADPNGFVKVNIMEYLKSLVDYRELFKFDIIAE